MFFFPSLYIYVYIYIYIYGTISFTLVIKTAENSRNHVGGKEQVVGLKAFSLTSLVSNTVVHY